MTTSELRTSKQVRRITGEVISHKTPKTAVVKVTAVKIHPKYKKRYFVIKRYMAHDPQDAYKVGDKVEIVPSRPYSRRKRFIIIGKAA